MFQRLGAQTANKYVCLPVCLPQTYYSLCLKLDLFRITILYVLSVDEAFFVKIYSCNKIGPYRLNNIQLKETSCASTFKRVCRSLYWRHASVLWKGHRVLRSLQLNRNKIPSLFCFRNQYSNAHAQQIYRMKKTCMKLKLETINISYVTFYHSTANNGLLFKVKLY